MDYSNLFSAGAYGIGAVGQLASGYAQSEALRAQGDFAVAMAEVNRRFAAERARDVTRAGDQRANQIRVQARRVAGAQRASAAAQGIAADDGSAADLQSDTRFYSEDEQITTRNNAWREAFGIETQANMDVDRAKFQRKANNAAADATLLGGVFGAAGSGMQAAAYGSRFAADYRKMTVPDTGELLEPTQDYSLSADLPSLGDSSFSNTFFRADFARRNGGL